MFEDFPTIRIVPLNKLEVHEWHDNQRTPPLIEGLRASGILRNPPIISPFNDGSERYLVLDGANRTTALTEMGFPHVIAQVIEPDAPTLDLRNWNHVCWGLPPAEFISGMHAIVHIDMEPVDNIMEADQERVLAWVQTPDGQVYAARTDAETQPEQVKLLNVLVDSYKERCQLDRTRITQISAVDEVYEQLSGLVIFPHFNVEDIFHLCDAGILLPPGITRFSVSPRALRINYPLEILSSDRSLEDKNAALGQWLQERVARKGVRFYAEPTVLFDE